jgi:hypothetical protein
MCRSWPTARWSTKRRADVIPRGGAAKCETGNGWRSCDSTRATLPRHRGCLKTSRRDSNSGGNYFDTDRMRSRAGLLLRQIAPAPLAIPRVVGRRGHANDPKRRPERKMRATACDRGDQRRSVCAAGSASTLPPPAVLTSPRHQQPHHGSKDLQPAAKTHDLDPQRHLVHLEDVRGHDGALSRPHPASRGRSRDSKRQRDREVPGSADQLAQAVVVLSLVPHSHNGAG